MSKSKNDEMNFEIEERDRQIPDKLFELAMACSFDAFMITTAEKGFPIGYTNDKGQVSHYIAIQKDVTGLAISSK